MLERKGQRHMRHQGMGTGTLGERGHGGGRVQGGEILPKEQNRTATQGKRSRQENAEAGRLEYREHKKARWGEGPRAGRGWRLEGGGKARWRPGAPH